MPEKIKRWNEGPVERKDEHFELRVGADGGWNDWLPVALIGVPNAGVVSVEFLAQASTNPKAIEQVTKEIEFYFLELGEPNPWRYAQYHCGTTSNVYSNTHWSFFESTTGEHLPDKNVMQKRQLSQ